MKSYTNVSSNKPKKKVVSKVIYTRSPGEEVQKGKKAEVKMTATRGTTTRTYTPSTVETGHKAYGKPGGGTNKEMNKLIEEAREKKRDVTAYSSKGLHYKAGTTTEKTTPATFKTEVKVTPSIRKVNMTAKTVTEKAKTSQSGGNLKARAVTAGGSTKGDHPATKYGIGKKSGMKVRRIVRH